jgi:hypothetical protein
MKKEKTKWYEVEIKGTTYRTYDIKAESKEKAEELALSAVDEDWEISKAWKRNAEVESCEKYKIDKDGVKIIG